MKTSATLTGIEGYAIRLHPHNEAALFIVRPDGSQYLLRPFDRTCSCPGFSHRGRCKHLRYWQRVLLQTADHLARQGDFQDALNLAAFRYHYLGEHE